MIQTLKNFLWQHRALMVALLFALFVALGPALEAWYYVGSSWQGVVPAYGDELLYYAQAHAIEEGHWGFGNPYLLEHANDPSLVLFGGTYLSAIPLLLYIPLMPALTIDFILWGIVFVVLGYLLLRELWIPKWASALFSLLMFVQTCGMIYRMSSRQTVYPFFFLLFWALIRFLKDHSRRNAVVLGISAGLTFWVFSYLWQAAVIMLGLLALYALLRREWTLLQETLVASAIGGVIGLPTLMYMYYLSHTRPEFWESIARFGLVDTHLPMAEIVYSGGWIAIALTLIVLLYWRARFLFEDRQFLVAMLFLTVTGLGLWIEQGSNAITGKLLETGEHLKGFIATWIFIAVPLLGMFLWRARSHMAQALRVLSFGCVMVLMVAGVYIARTHLNAFLFDVNQPFWKTQQLYAGPYTWLNTQAPGAVVWGDSHNFSTTELPVYTHDFVLYTQPALFHLVPNTEIQERYLISEYFDNPSVGDLKADIIQYVGRQDAFHHAKTIERGIKICRIFFFWDSNHACGVPPTSQELLGEKFFSDLEKKFQTDIKPNIKAYLKKYHVSYILKDIKLNVQIHPERLGAKRVYSDGRFEIYKLP